MTIKEGTIYKCDHCGKKQFRKCDMSRHEKWCIQNPNNWHKCFDHCNNLVKSEETYQGDEFIGKRTVFTCNITKQKMYSYLAERRNLPVVKESDTIRMPLSCELYRGYSYLSNADQDY